MDMLHIHEGGRKFLLQSISFCQAVGPYIIILGLNPHDVAAFRKEIQTALYIKKHYRPFAYNFMLYNIGAMRKHLQLLVHSCRQSPNYTKTIADALAIDDNGEINAGALRELDFYKGHHN